jgi:hypothetical protein
MGTQAICAFCEDKETDENLINHTSNFAYFGSNKNLQNQESNLNIEENPLSFTFTPAGSNYSKIISDFGIIKWSNNSIFKGYFKNNIPNGWGIYEHHTNGTFKGEYSNDQPNGYGIYIHITDSVYEGYWKNERQDGIGIEKWSNDSIYIGEFNHGKKNGIGRYIFPNKNIYYGEWEQNLMNGYGIYLFDKDRIFIGEWLNGLKDGYGEIYSTNHNYFFGYYKNNIQNGFFIFYNNKTGKIIVGYNTNGKVDGIAKYFMPKLEGRILIVKNGHKVKEIKDIDSIKSNEVEGKKLNDYFFMTRKEIEPILNKKICNENYNEMLDLLKGEEEL